MPLDIEINTSIGYEYKALRHNTLLHSFKGVGVNSVIYSYVQGMLYTYITESLLNGSHDVDVIAVDDFLNESTDLSDSITINTFLRPAQDLIHVFDSGDNSIDLTWTLSLDDADATFAFYNVYSNSGSGSIDYTTPVTQLAAGVVTYDTGVLAIGDWLWAIRVEKTDGKIEENVDNIISQKIPDEPSPIGLPGANEQDTFISIIPVSGGKVFIEFPYLGTCDHFNIYWNDVGSDLSDFSFVSADDSFTRVEGIFQSHTTIQATTKDNTEVYFLIRPVSATAVIQANTNVISVTLDGKNPEPADNLVLTAVGDDSNSEATS
tara:strand:+ start:2906 stop:3865 length:960 start_codon:yes stop_codon:yes gene_type:complete